MKFKNEFTDEEDFRVEHIADSLKIKPWAKADFDNNGRTDIVVIGNDNYHNKKAICILDKRDKLEKILLSRKTFGEVVLPLVENNDIKYFTAKDYADENVKKLLNPPVMLTYKFGDFVEKNNQPAKHKIEQINFRTTPCYGSCPVFNLLINPDRTSEWETPYDVINKEQFSGNYHTTISQEKFDELINLLNYIDFTSLKDNYAVNWTDDQTSYLNITYDGGKVKTIKDYGLIGTFGLNRVYKLLFDLRENQQWTKLIDRPLPNLK